MVKIEETASSQTYYDETRDVIVIDERLREYPKALKMSVFHELKHAYIENQYNTPFRKFVEHAKHELATDIQFAFSTAEKHRQFREYLRKENDESGRGMLLSLIRSLWATPLYFVMNVRSGREAN